MVQCVRAFDLLPVSLQQQPHYLLVLTSHFAEMYRKGEETEKAGERPLRAASRCERDVPSVGHEIRIPQQIAESKHSSSVNANV